MRWRVSSVSLAIGIASAWTGMDAQVVASVDFGAGSIDYEDAPAFYVYSISPRVSFTEGVARVVSAATFSRFENEGWGTRILAAASLLSPAAHGFRAEFSVLGEANSNRITTAGSEFAAQGRAHYASRNRGVWVGASGARVWNGLFWQNLVRQDAGLWLNLRNIETRIVVVRSRYETEAGADEGKSYFRTESSFRYFWRSLELEGSIGGQFDGAAANVLIWAAGANFWLNHRMALVASAGKYAVDPAQALPGGSYMTFGMRLAPVPFTASPARVARPIPRRSRALSVFSESDSLRTFRFVGPRATVVELSGSFTDWRPVRMIEVAPGVWEVRVQASEGSHLLNVRVDGGEWMVPEGLAAIDDDFNGRVGRILITR